MKKLNKKGFTLIELLAIIVILAIIAVITVPIILNIIDNARRGAAKNSVAGYAEAVKFAFTEFEYDKAMNQATAPKSKTGVEPVSVTIKDTATNQTYDFYVTYDGDDVDCETANGHKMEIDNGVLKLEKCTVDNYSSTITFDYTNGTVTASDEQ